MVFPFIGVVPCETGYAPLGLMATRLGAVLHAHAVLTGVAQLGNDHYVLLLHGEALGIFQVEAGNLHRRTIADLETEGHFELAASAPELVMALAAALSETPAVKGASSLIDVDKLLANLETTQADGQLTLERNGEFAVARIEHGQLTFLSGCEVRDHDSIREQMLLFCYEQPGVSTIVQVFTEQVAPDARIARSFREWLEPKAPAPSFYVTCSRHGKILERRLCKDHELRIGRDRDNDIVIDQRSISRHHVAIVWDGLRYKAKDQGSVNGTLLNGRRFEMAPLKSGDRLLLGQVEVRFDLEQAQKRIELATVWSAAPMAAAPKAQLVRFGRTIDIERPVFSLGSSATSDLRIDGWWVRPTQATIVLDNGRFYLGDAGGGPRRVCIGQQRVYSGGAVLQDGDEIKVAGETLLFRETTAAPAQRDAELR